MNNVFNKMQMFETSNDCKKFSKSVSYETLVGGTTTIGRGIKQTRRLSKCSAVKPLTAVGTLTSLLCNSAKVVESLLRHVITRRTLVRRGYLPEQATHANKESLFASVTCFMRLPRRIQRMLLVMTIPAFVLALLFSLITIRESRAACNITNDNGDTVDEFGNYCGTCGADCHWVLDGDGNMKITGSGKMANYTPTCVAGRNPYCTTEDRPWQKYREQIKNVDIQGVTTVGTGAFYTIPIENLTLGNSITALHIDAFENHKLKTIELPDSLTKLEGQALDSNFLKTLIIPDTLNNFVLKSFNINNINIVCRGESSKCNAIKEKMIELGYNNNFSLADISNCDTENFYWTGTNCARKDENGNIFCASGYAEYKNRCWDELPFAKKRWTPAEANQWLHDGNDNFVVITFKK